MKTIITFDYELFLGPYPGSVEKCLIEPTERYLNLARLLNIKYVFFVDVLFLLKLKELTVLYNNLESTYLSIVMQLKQAALEGHDLQLHLHPQWYYSNYNHDGWQMDFTHYALIDCPVHDVEVMISSGCKLIEEICGVRPNAYRAGGYSFPNSQTILDIFEKEGIKYDSSVLLGCCDEGSFQKYNYSSVKDFKYYTFRENNAIEDKNGIFVECPITCTSFSELYCSIKLKLNLYVHRESTKISGDGKGIGVLSKKTLRKRKGLSKLFERRHVKASLDYTNAYFLKNLYEKVTKNQGSLFVIIGHPKNATEHSYKILKKSIIRKSIGDIITFRDM